MEILAFVVLVAGILLFCGIVGTVLTRARISAEWKMIWGMISLWLLSMVSLLYVLFGDMLGVNASLKDLFLFMVVMFFYLFLSAFLFLTPMILVGLYGLRSIQSSTTSRQRVFSIIKVFVLAEAVFILHVWLINLLVDYMGYVMSVAKGVSLPKVSSLTKISMFILVVYFLLAPFYYLVLAIVKYKRLMRSKK